MKMKIPKQINAEDNTDITELLLKTDNMRKERKKGLNHSILVILSHQVD